MSQSPYISFINIVVCIALAYVTSVRGQPVGVAFSMDGTQVVSQAWQEGPLPTLYPLNNLAYPPSVQSQLLK